jgi:ferredoxin-thioredoxin reductase catalytic subunit
MREDDAKDMWCPFNNGADGFQDCKATECMLWVEDSDIGINDDGTVSQEIPEDDSGITYLSVGHCGMTNK